MTDLEPLDVVVIGAGITGLSAAFYAQKAGYQVRVVESGQRPGGKIRSERVSIGSDLSFLLEWGADSMLSLKPEGLALACDLGIENEIVPTRTQRQIYMLRSGRLLPMPEGLQLVIPTRLWPFIHSPLFTWTGKMRMGLDLLLPKRVRDDDESVASFTRRRLGQEALDFLAEPILSGIYSSDPERQSLTATFPQLRELERAHRSLILGAMRSKKKSPARPESLFLSFRLGMQTLTDALAKVLREQIDLNCGVTAIRMTGDVFEVVCGPRIFKARNVILTTGSRSGAALLNAIAPQASALLKQVRLTSSGCVFLAYRKEDIGRALDGYGVLIPKTEKRDINAVTWVSSKLEGRAPPSHSLLRVFFGGERNPGIMLKSDDEIVDIALREAAQLHDIKGSPVLTRVFRSHEGNPQYDIGHLTRVKEIETDLPHGLIVTGCFMRGVGVPDCIRQAKEALVCLKNG